RRKKLEALEAPTANDEYLIYQTLVGAWPDRHDDASVAAAFADRIDNYLIKVVREAKAVSSWVNPNEDYEAAITAFARGLLIPPENQRFLADFLPFQRKVAWFGRLNSLAQTLLKLTAPGVPDIYQGCELPRLALVDPDNRRPVDFDLRRANLSALQAAAAGGAPALAELASELVAHLDDGRLKQFLIWRALELRRLHDAVFRDGAYLPLAVAGAHAGHVCAFARVQGEHCAVVVVPRLVCGLLGGQTMLPLGATVWGDTCVDVGSLESMAWEDVVSGSRLDAKGGHMPLADVFARLPIALLVSRT